jgi:hypothetical protein
MGNVFFVILYWASALRAFMASRRNILFRYFTEYAIYGGFLEDVTKADVLIGPKLSDFGD